LVESTNQQNQELHFITQNLTNKRKHDSEPLPEKEKDEISVGNIVQNLNDIMSQILTVMPDKSTAEEKVTQ